MKKHLLHVVNANFFSKFIKTSLVVVLLAGSAATFAQASPVSFTSEVPASAAVTFVAASSESMFFDVTVPNAEGEKFVIVVKDEAGTTLYRGTFSGKEFKKRFVLPKTDASKITFQ